MHPVDAAIVLAFVVYAANAGWRERRRAARGLGDYFLAGRSLDGWSAGISMAATQFAADTPLLVTGLIATAGIFSLWRLWIYAVAFLLLGFVLAPCWRRARVVTDAELAELRYAGRAATALRAVKALYFGTVFNCTVLAMVLFAAKEITEPFLLWDRWLPTGFFDALRTIVETFGVPLARATGEGDLWVRSTNNLISLAAIVVLTFVYSATGGLRAVVRTDVVQFSIMMVGTAAYATWLVVDLGGVSEIVAKLHALFPGGTSETMSATQLLAFTPWYARDASFAILAVFALQWLVQMNADGTGYLAQRVMACRSDRDARLATVVFTVAQIVVRSLLWIVIALALLVAFPPSGPSVSIAEREATFVRGIAELLPVGVRGVMLTGMLAALASTVDTHLNWGASYWTNDLYDRLLCRGMLGREPKPSTLVWVARISNLVVLAIAIMIMTRLSSIQVAWHASLLLGAGMGIPLLLRWLWWRMNAWGELGAIAASSILAPLLLMAAPEMSEAARLLAMALTATLGGLAASLLTAPESAEQLARFYARARPPGLWRPVANACGDDPQDARRRLWRGLGATVLSALSVFCLLVGTGAWLVDSPVVPWSRSPVWALGVLALGLVFVPLWWRIGFATGGSFPPGGRSR